MSQSTGVSWKDRLYMQASSEIPEVRENALAILNEIGRLERALDAAVSGRGTSGRAASAEVDAPGWIPVSDRLPSDEDRVLVAWHTQDNGVVMDVETGASCKALAYDITLHDPEDAYVTHWMPLPLGPKGKRDSTSPVAQGDRHK